VAGSIDASGGHADVLQIIWKGWPGLAVIVVPSWAPNLPRAQASGASTWSSQVLRDLCQIRISRESVFGDNSSPFAYSRKPVNEMVKIPYGRRLEPFSLLRRCGTHLSMVIDPHCP
jgi:hypothetical protein